MSWRAMSDEELMGALSSLEPDVAGSEVATAVARRIAGGPGRVSRRDAFALWPRGRRRFAVALAVFVLATTVAAGSKVVIGAIQIQRAPEAAYAPSTVPETGPNLGRAVTLVEAEARVKFQIMVPMALGDPDAVFLDHAASRVSMTWLPRSDLPRIAGTPWGAILIEFGGDDILAVKQVPTEGSPEAIDIAGTRGYWLEGPHTLQLADGTALRVSGNVVILERDGTTLRLETVLDRAGAIRTAASMEPIPSESGDGYP